MKQPNHSPLPMRQIRYYSLAAYTERLLPYRKPLDHTEANANNQCEVLRQFWLERPELKTVVLKQIRESMKNAELEAWWTDFNARYPHREAVPTNASPLIAQRNTD